MDGKLLAQDPHLTIQYDVINDTLTADWKGEQTEETVHDGCEKILQFMTAYRCVKLLNDNTQVAGMWSDAAEWVALNWVPRMEKAGCRFIAHVYSPDIYARLSVDKTIDFGIKGILVTTFQGKKAAEEWLCAV
ncbi:hypothetical protein [Rufibacter hautae]|uniref:STAS/SEC14 domain-containing protein n=1 Tax=Rufibacter hautae TaxID=2595005 RepID=A0A5B6TD53_9BACT|nr:hypothetical protein [Rufibacter hautae]KAA3436881.1 hypothetical protein FOA19_21135 [Rufibacter hautae]